VEGAIALAKFGQYGRALDEFRSLLSEDAARPAAAKNILRCHISRQTYEDGVEEYRKWAADGVFSSSQSEIGLLVPSREKGGIEHLRVGTRFKDIAFYSPFAMFQCAGVVTANTKIAAGPKRGDFSLDIRFIGN
jgi:hypothetical protein